MVLGGTGIVLTGSVATVAHSADGGSLLLSQNRPSVTIQRRSPLQDRRSPGTENRIPTLEDRLPEQRSPRPPQPGRVIIRRRPTERIERHYPPVRVPPVIVVPPGYPYPDPWGSGPWGDRHPGYRHRYRDTPPPDALPPLATEDCTALTVMARLAYVVEPAGQVSDWVTGGQIAACRGRGGGSLGQWSNGRAVRFGDSFSYPNGQSARFSNSWYYPNGQTLNQGSSWNYPNGRSARFGPYWYTPGGATVSEQELISWSCGVLGTRRCGDRLNAVRNAPEFWYHLTLIELAWQAATERP